MRIIHWQQQLYAWHFPRYPTMGPKIDEIKYSSRRTENHLVVILRESAITEGAASKTQTYFLYKAMTRQRLLNGISCSVPLVICPYENALTCLSFYHGLCLMIRVPILIGSYCRCFAHS